MYFSAKKVGFLKYKTPDLLHLVGLSRFTLYFRFLSFAVYATCPAHLLPQRFFFVLITQGEPEIQDGFWNCRRQFHADCAVHSDMKERRWANFCCVMNPLTSWISIQTQWIHYSCQMRPTSVCGLMLINKVGRYLTPNRKHKLHQRPSWASKVTVWLQFLLIAWTVSLRFWRVVDRAS